MIIKVDKSSYKRTWFKLYIDLGMGIHLTSRELDVLVEMSNFVTTSLKERKQISGALNCSEQVITNNLKTLREKELITLEKEDKCYYYTLVYDPPTLRDLLNTKNQIEFTIN